MIPWEHFMIKIFISAFDSAGFIVMTYHKLLSTEQAQPRNEISAVFGKMLVSSWYIQIFQGSAPTNGFPATMPASQTETFHHLPALQLYQT